MVVDVSHFKYEFSGKQPTHAGGGGHNHHHNNNHNAAHSGAARSPVTTAHAAVVAGAPVSAWATQQQQQSSTNSNDDDGEPSSNNYQEHHQQQQEQEQQQSTSTTPSCAPLNLEQLDTTGSQFWRAAKHKAQNNIIQAYQIDVAGDPQLAVSNRAFICATEQRAYFEATSVVTQENKEKLTALLELAESAGCDSVVAAIPRQPGQEHYLRQVMTSLVRCNFSIVSPTTVALDDGSGGTPGFVCVMFEI